MPSRRGSSKPHQYFVAGHSPKPPAPGRYGSSWQASWRLGSAESVVRVSNPRSRTKAAASSSVSSARSGVRRHSCARRSCSSRRADTASLYSARVATAAIVTIGNELLSGDVANTNGSWIARRLEAAGVTVRLVAVLPDEIETAAGFLRLHAPEVDVVIVTGGLGGTADDVPREVLAATYGVPQVEFPELTASLRARFTRDPDYVTPWAMLPEGSRPLENPLGGAPGFAIGNVYVLPGLPAEMEAMYELVEAELAGAA